ncbi:hypothetical protein A3Q56_05161 [Intoshia linei]|uniref:Uncharacterized protein n=1 Tax=Intoshia linei TaxID=1819745 RepID=A0A177AYL3_9BILA|nr:hypothetical protein A3Q56_05161 [Intoshia linei]
MLPIKDDKLWYELRDTEKKTDSEDKVEIKCHCNFSYCNICSKKEDMYC